MKVLLIRKLIGLGRDEDGAALVITLALLMFMYVTCAGVLAIGQSAKDRIHLQNACDAAAYSAAVVQADTLSRIATINKAMAWTYKSMVCRQMDYVVSIWLNEACKRYDDDQLSSEEVAALPDDTYVRRIQMNDAKNENDKYPFESDVRSAANGDLSDHMHKFESSFYETLDLKKQIIADGVTINEMNTSLTDLRDGLFDRKGEPSARLSKVIQEVLLLNAVDPDKCWFQCNIKDDWSRVLKDEEQFLKFIGQTKSSAEFSDRWFPIESTEGIKRWYKGDIVASWYVKESNVWVPIPKKCRADECKAEWEFFNELPAACPLVLKEEYFGQRGTITVGLARYNENPWARVFGPKSEVARNGMDRLAGIFAAFNPYKHVEWSWAFSAAKAGYREKGGEYDGTRAYRVDWDSQDPSWNLCVSDWDAVFVPVRSACMEAKDGSWKLTSGNNDFLKKWIESGDWKAFDGFNPPQYDLARNGMPRLPRMHNARGTIHDINWTRLRDMLYH